MNETDKELWEIMESGARFSTQKQIAEAYALKFTVEVAQSTIHRFLKKHGYVKNTLGSYMTKEEADTKKNTSKLINTIYDSGAKLNDSVFHSYILINNCNGYSERFIDYIKLLAPAAMIIKTETDSLLIFEIEEGDLDLVRTAWTQIAEI